MPDSASEQETATRTGSPGAGPSPGSAADGTADAAPDPADAMGQALAALAEAGTYAREWVSAKRDGLLLGARKLAFLGALGVVAGLVGVTFVITSTVLLLQGISAAIAVAMPQSFGWVGPFVVGLVGVVLSVGGLWLVLKLVARAGRRNAINSYRRRLLAQHRQFGTDAYSRAVGRAAKQTPQGPKPAGEAVETDAAVRLRRDLDLLRNGN